MMLALSRQEQGEEPLTDLLDLWSHSESYSFCRGERLFARRGGSKSVGRSQSSELEDRCKFHDASCKKKLDLYLKEQG
jgi:hypothetical protein